MGRAGWRVHVRNHPKPPVSQLDHERRVKSALISHVGPVASGQILREA
jgi:hypothetical protein